MKGRICMNFLQAAGQAVDFVWKACASYAKTAEGQKELDDVIIALEFDDNQAQESESSSGSTLEEAMRNARKQSREG